MANIIQLGSPFAAGQSPYDIFQDRMRTVAAIVENYKQWQEKKWDTEWQQAALSDIDKAKNQQTDILLQNINPPADKIDVEGATQFADKAMGMLQQKELMTGGLELKQPDEAGMVQKKEIMTGGLESKSIVTATAPMKEEKPETAQSGTVSKTIPDISEFNELMKFVQDLPTGEVNWDNTLSLFEQRLQKKRSLGDAATQFLNQILGQGIPDQRARFENDFNLSKNIMQTLYPETEQQQETFDPEAFLQSNPDMEITGYNSNTGGYTFSRKQEIEGKPQVDINELVSTLEQNGMKLSSANYSPTTGNLSYSFTAEKTDTGTAKASWEGNLAKAQQFIQSNPDYEITGTNPDSGSVTISKMKPQGEEGTNKTTPTYSIIQSINKDLLDPTKDYDRVLAQAGVKYDLSDPNINFVTKDERAKKIYEFALTGDEKTYGIKDGDIVDEDGFVEDEAEYNLLYQEYEKGAKEYYEATGQLLPKEYLSPEEAGRFITLTPGKGYKGGLKPVKNTENIPWSWAGNINKSKTNAFIHDAQASGYTLADYDIEELKKAGVDIEKARQALGN
ncbi:MAG: hypothetical protein GXY51_02510 [Bacteroidetes bacterium]|nr:hypothetical protein [Bacteroidota bacterium]